MNGSTNSSFPAETKEFVIVLKVAVGIACLLSIIGAASIILSFIFCKEIRTTSRFLLFNLSIADMITAIAILIGVLDSYKYIAEEELYYPNSTASICSLQPFFSLYGTDSSILWTIALMAYLNISLTCYRPTVLVNRIIVAVSMLLCWGIPLPIVVIFLIEGFFGFKPGFSPGFCTIVTEDRKQVYRIIIGYWMFLWLSFAVLPILSTIFICHTRCKMKTSESYHILEEHVVIIRAAERKLLFVPIAFMIIRVWGLVDGITFILPKDTSDQYRNMNISAFFVLMTGIGGSAQGFVNGIFFWLLTPAVRYRVKLACNLCCPWKFGHKKSYVPTSIDMSASYSYSVDTSEPATVPSERLRSITVISDNTFYGSNKN